MGLAVHHKDQGEARRKVLVDDRMVPVAARHTGQGVVLRKDHAAAVRRSGLALEEVHHKGQEAARRGCNGAEVALAHMDLPDHTALVLLARLQGHQLVLGHQAHPAVAAGRQRLPVQAQVPEQAQQPVLLLVLQLELLLALAVAMPVLVAPAVEAGTPAAAAAVDMPSAVAAAPARAALWAAALVAAAPAPAAVGAAAAAAPEAAAAVAVDHSASARRPQQRAWSKWTPASPHCSNRRPGHTGRPARVGTSLESAALTSRALAPHPNFT